MAKLSFETKKILVSIGESGWKIHRERFPTSYNVWLGPMFFKKKNLPICNEAVGRQFDRMNHPDSPLRRLSDMYRRNG